MSYEISRSQREKCLTIVEYEAIWELKPFDQALILCISWKHAKASLFSWIKCEYQLLSLHHFLKIKM